MLDKNVFTFMNGKNNKTEKDQITRLLGMPFSTVFRCHDSGLEISTPGGYTLIPRTMITNIRVFPIRIDIRMNDSQRQHTRVFYHGNMANNHEVIINNTDELHTATYNGDVTRVEEVVHRNKELIGCKDSQGNIPLHVAVKKGHKEVALYLIKEFPQGSYSLNHLEKSPLYLAVVEGHMDLVESMLKHLAGDSEALHPLRNGKSMIFAAITAQSLGMVQLILKHQPKLINSANEEGWSPLSYAAHNGLVDIVSFILETFPKFVHKDSSYPIQKACIGGHVHVLEKFHTHSPKIFTKPDKNGLTILHHAAKAPHNKLKDVVSYLLSLQDSQKLVKMKDETNRTPFDLARYSRNDEVMQLFLQNHR